MTLTTEQRNQIRADIAARKAMPEYGESVEGNIERLRVIGATRGHFSTETVEMLVRALEEKSRALADAERERDDWVEHSRKMEYRVIEAKEKLANREAWPVLYASEETLAYAKEGEKSLVTWSEPMGDAVIPLFTVPKAQTPGVVNLPTEFISDEGVMVRLEQVMAALALVGVKYERRGDACRAAMLESAAATSRIPIISDGYKLADGWIACSERMPVDTQTVLCSNLLTELSGIPFIADYVGEFQLYDGTKYESGFYINRELQTVTHWMPLPAAPEGVN